MRVGGQRGTGSPGPAAERNWAGGVIVAAGEHGGRLRDRPAKAFRAAYRSGATPIPTTGSTSIPIGAGDGTLRSQVRLRAAGFCEYCRIPERFTLAEHEIDHVIAVKHGGQAVSENLALCWSLCNRFKGSEVASIDSDTGQPTPLFHPRADRWVDHFDVCNGEIRASTANGRATVRLLRMNRPARCQQSSENVVF